MDPNVEEHILTPLLYLDFEERPVSTISADTFAFISYYVDYFEDLTNIRNDLIGIFVTANLIVIIIVAVRIYNWTRHNPAIVLKNKFA